MKLIGVDDPGNRVHHILDPAPGGGKARHEMRVKVSCLPRESA
ncbi:MAG: hypothetical protein ACXIVE_07920 [Salinarimonas sp.]